MNRRWIVLFGVAVLAGCELTPTDCPVALNDTVYYKGEQARVTNIVYDAEKYTENCRVVLEYYDTRPKQLKAQELDNE